MSQIVQTKKDNIYAMVNNKSFTIAANIFSVYSGDITIDWYDWDELIELIELLKKHKPCNRCGGTDGKHRLVDDPQAGNSHMLTTMQCPLDK